MTSWFDYMAAKAEQLFISRIMNPKPYTVFCGITY